MKIGYFKHWFQPPYPFVKFLEAEGYDVEQIDYSLPGYLEKYDVALVEQNGFNDYIENDEPYIADWVQRRGANVYSRCVWWTRFWYQRNNDQRLP